MPNKPSRWTSGAPSGGHHLIPSLTLAGAFLPVVLALGTGILLLRPHFAVHAAGNGDCTLVVPANPLSAQGLATPYQLLPPCHEADPATAAFVQGAVINRATGAIAIYDPLVIDQGTQPAVQPVVPQLPPAGVVALWFGTNANTLTLQDSNGSLRQGQCVNGITGSIFGQFAYCNAPAFFKAANQAMQAHKLVPPPLGQEQQGQQGLPCPSVRDFSIVDQDQSDNVTTTYLVTAKGIAQDTAANVQALGGQVQKNGSDERLLTLVDQAVGCSPWMAPNLADAGKPVAALPLNELQAASRQAAPIALVPEEDPMTLVNTTPNAMKTDVYRAGVDQPRVAASDGGNTMKYCGNLLTVAPPRLVADALLTGKAASPDTAVANSLFTFLLQRFQTTFEGPLGMGLQCAAATKGPIQVQLQNGVATSATITVNGQPPQCFMSDGQVDTTGKTCMQPATTP